MNITLGIYLTLIKTNRAAVLPYIIRESIIYFLLAIDKKSGDITDLGGGVKKHECSLSAALREFKEETREIFDELYSNVNDTTTNIAIVYNKMSVLFIPLKEEWYDIAIKKFSESSVNKKSYNEISNLIWVDQYEFKKLLDGKNRLWNKIKHFYKNNYDDELIEALKIIYTKMYLF